MKKAQINQLMMACATGKKEREFINCLCRKVDIFNIEINL